MWAGLVELGLELWGGTRKLFALGSKLPWQMWAVLALAVALHLHFDAVKVRRADATGYSRAKAEVKAQIDKLRDHAIVVRNNAEQLGAEVAVALKEEHNAKITSIGADVADIVRNGPGKAGCGRLDYPDLAALSSGQVAPAGTGDAAVAQVPDRGGTGFLALPLNDAARLFGQCDINRDEALKARTNDDRQRAIWDAYRKALAAGPK